MSMETLNLTECKNALDELKRDSQENQKKGLPFMMASVVIWGMILGVRMLDRSIVTLNMYTFFCSCYLMPLAWIFSKLIKANSFRKSSNPIDKLGFLCTMNQTLYLIIVMWAYNQKPEGMLMLYAIVFGAHLLPFGWIYDSVSYKFASVVEAIGALLIFFKWGNVPMVAFIIAMQIILCISLFVEVRNLKGNE